MTVQKIKHVLWKYFPENWRLWRSSYIQVSNVSPTPMVNYHTSFQDLKVRHGSVVPISQICPSAMFVLLSVVN